MNRSTRVVGLIAAGTTLAVFLWKEQYILALIVTIFLLLADQLARLISLKVKPTGFEITLGETIGRDRAKNLEERITHRIFEFEEGSGKKLTDEAKNYVFSVVSEGFLKRKSDLLEKYGIDLSDPDQIDDAVEKAIASLEALLTESTSTEKGEVTISNFSKPITGLYCQVWPFCSP